MRGSVGSSQRRSSDPALVVVDQPTGGESEFEMKLENMKARVAVALLTVPFAGLALAQTVDPMEAAFDQVEAKMTSAGGFAFAAAVVGALVWTGIKLFKKGVSAGGGKA